MLRDVIRRNGLKQREIAEAVGVAAETFSRWVAGRITPGGENLVRLLDFLRRHEPSLQADDLLPPPGTDVVEEPAEEPTC